MYKRNITVVIASVLFLTGCFGYILLGKGNTATELRNGISHSLDEDFKIKESLGQIFFAKNENESVAASSNATVSAMAIPAKGEYEFCEEMGKNKLKIYANKYSNVVACNDGIIESVDKNHISLRLADGKLAVYSGIGSLKKENDNVKKGDSIGFAKENVEVTLYENCILLNAGEFFY